ncbi:flagellar hook-basal body protein [Bradyrhizobium sp. LM3.6]
MSLYGVMRTGVSGMNAQSNKLSTVSDNIANVNTTGYKRASTEFSSLILKSGSGNYDSGAVETTVRYAISDAGNYQFTTSATDLAVQGNGFFVVRDPNGNNFLTRAGAFVPDSTGNLVNSAGFQLMGYNIANGATPTVAANGFGGLQVINVNQMALQASPSTKATVDANLDPSAAIIAGPPGPGAYTSKTSVVTYDNIGNAVTVDVYAAKTAANTWQIQLYDSSTGTALAGGLNTFTFDVTATGKGKLTAASPTSLTVTIPGGSSFNMDLSAMTQVASSFDFQGDGRRQLPVRGGEGEHRRQGRGHRGAQERHRAAELPDRARERSEPGPSDARSRQRLFTEPGFRKRAGRPRRSGRARHHPVGRSGRLERRSGGRVDCDDRGAARLHCELEIVPDRRRLAGCRRQPEALSLSALDPGKSRS